MTRILVVDDHVDSAMVLASLLRSDGFEVVALNHPMRAIELLAKQRFDAIITDLDMPAIDGRRVLEAARATQPGAKLVLVSGNPSIDSAELEGAAFVQKPIDYDAIVCALGDLARRAAQASASTPPPLGPHEIAEAFIAAPPPLLVVAADFPRYTIVSVNDAYLAATMSSRSDLVGRPMFEAFPDNPSAPNANGPSKLRASFDRVIESRRAHAMAVQRYDIPRRSSVITEFEERHWSPRNAPILRGGAVTRIVHHVEDVTPR